jgi:Leucine-rich repeat (LRR) protein
MILPCLHNCVNLEWFEINNNNLTGLPPGIFKSLKNLIRLNLAHNQFTILDDAVFQNLKKLKLLILNNNKLEEIPTSLHEVGNLWELYLGHNKLSGYPNSIVGRDKINIFLKDKKKNN